MLDGRFVDELFYRKVSTLFFLRANIQSEGNLSAFLYTVSLMQWVPNPY